MEILSPDPEPVTDCSHTALPCGLQPRWTEVLIWKHRGGSAWRPGYRYGIRRHSGATWSSDKRWEPSWWTYTGAALLPASASVVMGLELERGPERDLNWPIDELPELSLLTYAARRLGGAADGAACADRRLGTNFRWGRRGELRLS